VEPDLPAGLRLNTDGSISGTPSEPRATTTYSVTAGNSEGSSSFGVRISVAGRYAVGGVVIGLTGTGLVLTNNGIDPLAVDANGAFRFSVLHPAGAQYFMQVATQPSDQSCSVANGTGALGNSEYGNAVVTCSATNNKATRSVNTFNDAAQVLAGNTAGRVLYLTCLDGSAPHSIHGVVVDPLTAAVTPLGEAIHQFPADAVSAWEMPCGNHSVTTDVERGWVYVRNSATHTISVYAVARALPAQLPFQQVITDDGREARRFVKPRQR
jgi:hypothetical protein